MKEAYQPRKEDIVAMLDSLSELFQERGDAVTATLIAERMEQKLRRYIHRRLAAKLYKLLGFDSRRRNLSTDHDKYYVIPNPELLAEKRIQFCKVDINSSKNKNSQS